MFIRRILPLALALSVAALAGCAADESNGTDEGAADVSGSSIAKTAVGMKSISLGGTVSTAVYKNSGAKTAGAEFAAKAGDHVSATIHGSLDGKAFIYKETGDNLTLVSQADAKKQKDTVIEVDLHTAGTFVIAYTPTLGSETVATVVFDLAGTPASADDKLLKDMRAAFEGADNPDDLFTAVAASKLPAQAKKQLTEWNKQFAPDYPCTTFTWTFEGKKMFVVENQNDGGMYINFYAEDGTTVEEASQSESGNLEW